MNCCRLIGALGLMPRLQHDRAERIDEDQRRRGGLDLLCDARQHLVEIARRDLIAQIDEANRLIDLVEIEERELLLITQHLQRRFAEHGEEQRRPLPRRQGKHDLVRQRRLAGARRPRQ